MPKELRTCCIIKSNRQTIISSYLCQVKSVFQHTCTIFIPKAPVRCKSTVPCQAPPHLYNQAINLACRDSCQPRGACIPAPRPRQGPLLGGIGGTMAPFLVVVSCHHPRCPTSCVARSSLSQRDSSALVSSVSRYVKLANIKSQSFYTGAQLPCATTASSRTIRPCHKANNKPPTKMADDPKMMPIRQGTMSSTFSESAVPETDPSTVRP